MFGLSFDATHEAASLARQEARGLLGAAGLASDIAADLELIIAELVSNAVEQQPLTPIRLDVSMVDGHVLIAVANRWSRRRPVIPFPTVDADDGLPERGRGLAIVEALTDRLTIESVGEWTWVRCQRRLRSDDGDHPS